MEGAATLVIVPLFEEMEYIYHYLKSKNATCVNSLDPKTDRYPFVYQLSNRQTIDIFFFVIGEIGNVAAATRSLAPLFTARPRRCFMVGVAGSLDASIKLGDVAVANSVKILYADKIKRLDPEKEVWDTSGVHDEKIVIDSRKRFLSESFFRFRWASANWPQSAFKLSDYLRHLVNAPLPLEPVTDLAGLLPGDFNPSPTIRPATILGSDLVIDSDEFVDFIRHRNDNPTRSYYHSAPDKAEARSRNQWLASELTVVDMESFGYFMMAEGLFGKGGATVPQCYSIRGVSDFSSDKGRLDRETRKEVRRRAIMNALKVTLDMIDLMETNRLGA